MSKRYVVKRCDEAMVPPLVANVVDDTGENPAELEEWVHQKIQESIASKSLGNK